MDKRVAEAEECMKKAAKALKTSLIGLKFKPDFDSAASEYERAAVCYRNASKLTECRDVYLKAAECHESNGVLFHAAKCKEAAALVCKDLGEMDKAKQLMETAADIYAESGTPDTSAMALDKAAKFFEPVDPDKAIEIYKKALLLVQETDRSRLASEFLDRLTRLYLRQERYADAVANIEQEVDMYIEVREASKVGRLTTGLVLVQLMRGDAVAADKSYQASFKCDGFERTDDAAIIGSLITAYESGDEEKFTQCLNRPQMKAMDNEKPFQFPPSNLARNKDSHS
uniref:Gamma-soluble NSF attachment protein n=1 Tax=Plectus sambesii TaxID=2011161 RepID=A0A914VZ08_9BILA